jgi:hypothetical protein
MFARAACKHTMKRDPMINDESPRLSEATTQAIQLELIRRTQYEKFDGKRIASDLLLHRDWWVAVLFDRTESLTLAKLRDLPYNEWNADALFILASDEASAHHFEELGAAWLAESVQINNSLATQSKLGDSSLVKERLVKMWWR